MKQCNLNVILKPLLDDFEKITVGDAGQTFQAALANLSGDNLSSHMIGGFTMSFNSGRIFSLWLLMMKVKACSTMTALF